MLKYFFKKEQQVEKLIYSYLDIFGKIQENFYDAFFSCIENPACERFDFFVDQTDKYESKADDIIDEVNNLMYGKALIPDSREDIMNLLLELDKIPRSFEKILLMVKYQKLVIPPPLISDIENLKKISLESCDLLAEQVGLFLKRKKGVRDTMGIIDKNESRCDHIERRLVARIFDSDSEIEPFLKLQLKELVLRLGDISDQADRAAKLVNVLKLKRRV